MSWLSKKKGNRHLLLINPIPHCTARWNSINQVTCSRKRNPSSSQEKKASKQCQNEIPKNYHQLTKMSKMFWVHPLTNTKLKDSALKLKDRKHSIKLLHQKRCRLMMMWLVRNEVFSYGKMHQGLIQDLTHLTH
jgi:uncharacterized membrane protein YheB (UPF0754 family)